MRKIDFGQRLRGLRKQMGLSQSEFESLCGMQEGYISHLERGKRSPTLETLGKIADGIGMTLAQLLADEEPVAGEQDEDINKMIAYARKLDPKSKRDAVEIIKILARK